MNVRLAYGQQHLDVDFPADRTTVILPSHRPGLTDEKAAVLEALRNLTGAPALLEQIQPHQKICILFTDITAIRN